MVSRAGNLRSLPATTGGTIKVFLPAPVVKVMLKIKMTHVINMAEVPILICPVKLNVVNAPPITRKGTGGNLYAQTKVTVTTRKPIARCTT